VAYQQWDSCFPWIEDFAQSQKLADFQPRLRWTLHLDRLLRQAVPAFLDLFPRFPLRPYWSKEGQTAIPAFLAARQAAIEQLTTAA
jgi:hypothetical protein